MNASTELRHEHDILREQLTLLEAGLPYIYATPAATRRLTSALLPFLHAHIDREEASLRACRCAGTLPAELAERLTSDHRHDEARLAMLDALFSGEVPGAEEQFVAQAETIIRDLREHLASEEADVLPLLDSPLEPARDVKPDAKQDETCVAWLWGLYLG